MTREEIVKSMSVQDAIEVLKDTNCYGTADIAKSVILKALEQEPYEDCVSRQAVFETIDDCNSDGLKGIFCSYDDGERFKEYVKKLPSVIPMQSWIPVSERLPENKETVLVTFKHFISGNTIGLASVILLRGKPLWHVREQGRGTYDVLAWMPLPEPYKEEMEGEE